MRLRLWLYVTVVAHRTRGVSRLIDRARSSNPLFDISPMFSKRCVYPVLVASGRNSSRSFTSLL